MQSVSRSPAKLSGIDIPTEKTALAQLRYHLKQNINDTDSVVIAATLGSAKKESQRGFRRIKSAIICADPPEVRV